MQFMGQLPMELGFMIIDYIPLPEDIIRLAGSDYDNRIIVMRYHSIDKNMIGFIMKYFCQYPKCKKRLPGEYCPNHYKYYCDGCKQFNINCSKFFHDQHICPKCTICSECDCVRSPNDMYDEDRCFSCRSEGIECAECLQYIKLRAHVACTKCNHKSKPRSKTNFVCATCNISVNDLDGMYVHKEQFPKNQKYCQVCYDRLVIRLKLDISFTYKQKSELIT